MIWEEPTFLNNSWKRNKTNLVHMSSDICIYSEPSYTVSGGCKIHSGMTTGDTCVHILSGNNDSLMLNFSFSGYSLTTTTQITIYKFDSNNLEFNQEIYNLDFNDLTPPNSLTIPGYKLQLDGEYLIKATYEDIVCTNILSRLGERINTHDYLHGDEYGLYYSGSDFYFIAIQEPILMFNQNTQPLLEINQLEVTSVIPSVSATTSIVIPTIYNDTIVVALNGLTLAPNLDYTINGNLINFISDISDKDIVTIIGFKSNNIPSNILIDVFDYNSTIPSGGTSSHPVFGLYYNTDISKYEIYTQNSIVGVPNVNINGVSIAPNIDFTLDSTIPNRIILNGNLFLSDIVTVVYQVGSYLVGDITTPNPLISWSIGNPAQNDLGYFEFIVATDSNFTNIIQNDIISYINGVANYSNVIDTSLVSTGDYLYYRVINHKVCQTISSDNLELTKSSEVFTIRIMF